MKYQKKIKNYNYIFLIILIKKKKKKQNKIIHHYHIKKKIKKTWKKTMGNAKISKEIYIDKENM